MKIVAVETLAPLIIGQGVDDLGELALRLTHDSHFRWLGPERGSST
jgi:L-fuconate dehydratase